MEMASAHGNRLQTVMATITNPLPVRNKKNNNLCCCCCCCFYVSTFNDSIAVFGMRKGGGLVQVIMCACQWIQKLETNKRKKIERATYIGFSYLIVRVEEGGGGRKSVWRGGRACVRTGGGGVAATQSRVVT